MEQEAAPLSQLHTRADEPMLTPADITAVPICAAERAAMPPAEDDTTSS